VTPDPLLPTDDGHSEFGPDELDGLRPTYITTRGELNEAEQANIARSLERRRPSVDALLDDLFLRKLHRAMFGDVWTWAGRYRRREANIGSDPAVIAVEVRDLIEDARLWVTGPEPSVWVAARFHHRLVAVHPFPNGNGRHARLAVDFLLEAQGAPPPTWGAGLGLPTQELRNRYLAALRRADRDGEDLAALVDFLGQ
jgi:Fic-DOC domain mobile mystery protein B